MRERDRSEGVDFGSFHEAKRSPARAEESERLGAALIGAAAGGARAEAADPWAAAAPLLRRRYGQSNYAHWLEPLAVRCEEGSVALSAVDRTHAQRVRQHFLPGIEAALREIGFAGDVAIGARDGSSPRGDAAAATEVRPAPAPRPSFAERYTFDRFVVGESNRFAYEAARIAAECPGRVHNPLYLHGGVGRGKTHLATAVARAVTAAGRAAGLVCSAERFLSHGEREAGAAEEMLPPGAGDGAAGAVVFDDVQLLARDTATLDRLFAWIDAALARGMQVVLTCDLPPPAIPALAVRLRSRCEALFAAEILAPDLGLRREIVRRHAAAAGTAIADDVVDLVATAEGSSVRALEGAFNRVRRIAESTDRALTLAVARQALARRGEPVGPPGLDRIAAAVAAAFHLSVRDLRARRRRDREASLARQVAVHLARRLSGRPLAEIAADLGFRDHSVAAHASAALRQRLAADLELASRVDEIERRIGR